MKKILFLLFLYGCSKEYSKEGSSYPVKLIIKDTSYIKIIPTMVRITATEFDSTRIHSEFKPLQ